MQGDRLVVLNKIRLSLMGFVVLLACAPGLGQAPQPWPLWEAYTQHFLDDQGRVIDRSAGDRTTSEGQAYSMFFALVDNDRPHFEKLLNWTVANLAQGDLTAHLPAWNWGKTSAGEWKTLDDNSASDADLWMAYALLEAGRLWHDSRYANLGRIMATQIEKNEVVQVRGVGTTVVPGPRGFHHEPDRYTLNPSYLPLPVLVGLARVLPLGPWKAVLASLPKLQSGKASGGYAMDWVSAGPTGVRPVASPSEPTAGKREVQPCGAYDAIRVYLWLGIADPATPGQRDLLRALPAMAGYMKTAGTPPLEVDAQGKIVRPDAPVGFSAAVIPYLLASGLKDQAKMQAGRMEALRDPESSLYGRPADYYDQNLALFSTAWSEQRYRFDREGGLKVRWK